MKRYVSREIKSKFVAFRIDPYTYKLLVDAAEEVGVDVSELLRRLVRLYITIRKSTDIGLNDEEIVIFVKSIDNIYD